MQIESTLMRGGLSQLGGGSRHTLTKEETYLLGRQKIFDLLLNFLLPLHLWIHQELRHPLRQLCLFRRRNPLLILWLLLQRPYICGLG